MVGTFKFWNGSFKSHFIMIVITYPYWDSSYCMSVKGAHGDYNYIILSKFTYIRELRRLQPHEGQAISNDSF